MSDFKKFLALSLLSFLGCKTTPSGEDKPASIPKFQYESGAIVRGDTTKKELALVFTGDEFAEGGETIRKVLFQEKVPASFFFTGNFYRNPEFSELIKNLRKEGHYLGAHSDEHLLYCDWTNRDSLLVSRQEFSEDLRKNYERMANFGIEKEDAPLFLPPYEWYNDSISKWTEEEGLQLINFTRGTLSHADYTTPQMPNYRSSEEIFSSIVNYESKDPAGLNGFILLIHIGAGPEREDKFHYLLEDLVIWLKKEQYELKRVDALGTAG